ncbi:hypothetical protein CMV_022471 [Castanea mollissima]|uniref:Uncharacterized protein n=1 Tax=Castanea mollissima TaxID=60419 RepID=A0A8J4V801_9ROSI|nr:hypothetical protein CMV_022471 [Castanea mollissima]
MIVLSLPSPKAKTSLKALARIKNVDRSPLNSKISNEDRLDSSIRALKALIREESLDVVFLAESKSKSRKIEKIRSRIGFVDKYCVDPVGKSGGLAIFWKAGVDLEIVYSNKNVIASLVYSDPPSSPWLFLLIYGPPHVNGMARFWKCLEDLG